MKRILVFLVLLIFYQAGCGPAKNESPPPNLIDSIKTYRDIPGVTEEEIAGIEALKSGRDKFSYGNIPATEAFIKPDGSYGGFTKKFCDLLSGLFGISFVQEMYEWDELLEALEAKSVDFTGELTPTEERMQKYRMTFPIAERMLRVLVPADSNKIQSEEDVNGRRIGFLEGSITAESIQKVYPVQFEIVEVENYHAAASMIKAGEIDAFIDEAVADPAFDEYDFIRSKIFFPMVHEPVSMTTANHDLAPIISVFNKYIALGGVDKLYELYKEGEFEYAKYKLQKSFTDEEKNFIGRLVRRGVPVDVALESDNYPVSFYNENEGEFQGIALDVLAEISRLTGLTFTAANTREATWAELLEKVKTGETPMVAELLYSKAREEYFKWSAAPYSRSYYAIMSRSDLPTLATYQVVRSIVGVVRHSGHEDIYRELFPENDNLREYDSVEECLDALEAGEVDLLMASEYMLLFQTNYRERPGLKVNIRLNAPLDSHFGYHKDERILPSIIDKTLPFVETEAIEATWTGRVFDYAKKLAEARAFYLTEFVGMLSLMLIATVFLLTRNVRLSRKLKEIASKDALTDILNRRFFMELGLVQIERSVRTGGECFIIIFDLDHFKAVNDHYGHLAGDEVLKEIARRVKNAVRPYDLFGRYGGEEFIILMSEVDKPNVIAAVERIRQDVSRTPVEFEGRQIPISASFGIAYAAPVNDMHMATQHADEALYRAKEGGRNRVVFYE
jgi:diguanylate cyclase (GGDEF)-like protein